MANNDFRVTSIFEMIIRIWKKNVKFCGKTLSFYPKDVCWFSVVYLNEEELNQHICLIKKLENEISNCTYKKIKQNRKKKTKAKKNKAIKSYKLFFRVTEFAHLNQGILFGQSQFISVAFLVLSVVFYCCILVFLESLMYLFLSPVSVSVHKSS